LKQVGGGSARLQNGRQTEIGQDGKRFIVRSPTVREASA
jgi:hypothetical protein